MPDKLNHKNLIRPFWKSPVFIHKLYRELYIDYHNMPIGDWTEIEQRPPLVANFDVNDTCNAKCTFCRYKSFKPEGIMSMDLFKDALKQFVDLGATAVCLNPLVGETLLDPHFKERIDTIKEYREIEDVWLFTNGIALSKGNNIDIILNSGIRLLEISVGGFDRQIFKETMGVDKYDDFLQGVIQLLSANKKLGGRMKVHFQIRGRLTTFFTPDFFEKVLPLIDEGEVKSMIRYSPLFDSWCGFISKYDLPPGCKPAPKGILRLRPCQSMFCPVIMANGDVRACDCRFGASGKHDELIVGNIHSSTIAEIWNGERIKKLRRAFVKGYLAPCNTCNAYLPIRNDIRKG